MVGYEIRTMLSSLICLPADAMMTTETCDGTYMYYYDCENRLADVNDKATGNPVASYEYDFAGRRLKKTVYGSPDVVTKYCYDGDQVIAEYDYNDVSQNYELARKFIYGLGIDEPICMIDVADNNAVYYYHFDGLGSVVALSNVNGEIVEQYSYDVFGEPNRLSDVNNPYMFTGRRYDPKTGLYYYRARDYSPDIGRFMQVDPISSTNLKDPASKLANEVILLTISDVPHFNPLLGNTGRINLYTYVQNNPLNNIDPSGLLCCNWADVGFCLGGKYQWAVNNPGVVTACGMMCSACIASHFTAFWPCLSCGACVGAAIVSVAECFITNCEW